MTGSVSTKIWPPCRRMIPKADEGPGPVPPCSIPGSLYIVEDGAGMQYGVR